MRNRARLEVKLNYLDENLRLIRKLAPQSNILLMVKAQAYGLGDEKIIQRAFNQCHISNFGFATLLEAKQAIDYLPANEKFQYYIFSETGLEHQKASPEILNHYKNPHLIPVISSTEALDNFFEYEELQTKPLVLKFDTGMRRFGFSRRDIKALAERIKREHGGVINHLMTHFPCASSKKANNLTKSQYRDFLDIKAQLSELGIIIKDSSVSNSAAIERGIGTEESYIRPGLLAYGNYATWENASNWTGKPLAKLEVEALKVFFAKKGTPIGYSGVSLKKDSWVAVLPIGYADGLTQSFDKAIFSTQFGNAQFHGYMNMDISYLSFEQTDIDFDKLSNESITLIHRDAHKVADLSKKIGISAYQIYCQLSLRVPRVYKIR